MKKIKGVILTAFIMAMLCAFSFVSFAAGNGDKAIVLSAEGVSKTCVKLTWETDYGYSYYLVYRKNDSGKYKRITKVSEKYYSDKKLETGKTYTYKVVGVYGKNKVSSNKVKANPMKSVSASVCQGDKAHTVISWQYPKKELSAISGFYIYRKADGEKSFEKIDTYSKKAYYTYFDKIYTYEYTDTDSKSSGKTYTYKVVPYKGDRRGTGTTSECKINPYLYLSTKKNGVTIKWSKIPGAKEYRISADVYKLQSDGSWSYNGQKNIATLSSKDKREYTFKYNTNKYICEIQVAGYKPIYDYEVKVDSLWGSTESIHSLLRDVTVNKKLDSVDVINVRGEEQELAWTDALNDSDVVTFKKFEKLRFRKGMTLAEKISYVFHWIHYNTDYDYEYSISSSNTYVNAIFNYRTGQCLQYNGALAKYLTYLGLKSRVIMGYRMQSINHFWGEIKLCGRWYCMETGNYKKNGSWNNLCARYGYEAWGYNFCGEIT